LKIIGTNGGLRAGYQDISSTYLDEERLLAIEEERLSRIKHSPGKLPEKSLKWLLDTTNNQMNDINLIATHGKTWHREYPEQLREYYKSKFGSCPELEIWHHHHAHAASSYYASNFDSSLVLTMDSSGDGSSTQVWDFKKNQEGLLEDYKRPQSLGIFYSLITQACGFTRDSDEYKLMGLAPYGDPDAIDLSEILSWKTDRYVLDESFLIQLPKGSPQPGQQMPLYSKKLIQKLGAPRLPFGAITTREKNLAASAQKALEHTVLQLIRYWLKKTGHRKICLAGGVALNCVLNQRIMNLPEVDDIFIQPASSDAGISLGAAYLSANKHGLRIPPFKNTFLGRKWESEEVRQQLQALGLNFNNCPYPDEQAAKHVANGLVIGWFQGADEFGPRSLGARSILANPCSPEIQKRVNAKIKFRESFRPFCPSVLSEDKSKYFIGAKEESPYMTITYDVNEHGQKNLPGITHVNKTARIQTVNQQQDKLYSSYLEQLKKRTGHGVSLNTSFNRSNEPIAASVRDAVSIFFGSGLDALVIDQFIITK
jgi:carbamoyltransferase